MMLYHNGEVAGSNLTYRLWVEGLLWLWCGGVMHDAAQQVLCYCGQQMAT